MTPVVTRSVVLSALWVVTLTSCGENAPEAAPPAPPGSSAGLDTGVGGPDAGSDPDPGPSVRSDGSVPSDAGPRPMSPDAAQAGPDGGPSEGPVDGSPDAAPSPGPPPILDPTHPLPGAANPQRVLPTELTQSYQQLHWLPQYRSLAVTVSVGGRSYAEELDGSHAYRLWVVEGLNQNPSARELMQFPTPSHTRPQGETNWCAWSFSWNSYWCQHNFKKADERILNVSVDEATGAPERVRTYPLWRGLLHEDAMDFIDLADRTGFWTIAKRKQEGLLVRMPSDFAEGDELELVFEGRDVGIPHVHGVAVSPNEEHLYVTAGNYDNPDDGRVYRLRIEPDRSLSAPEILVGGIPRARDLTVDEGGNIYVASGFNVAVFTPSGDTLGVIEMVTDSAYLDEVEENRYGARYTILGVTFGGDYGNVLYAAVGYDTRGDEFVNVGRGPHILGGVWRVELQARGGWISQHGLELP